jgi:hypothetical protein
VDGLYRQLDSQAHCDLAADPAADRALRARIDVRYIARRRAFAVTAENPVTTALDLLPGQCQSQGDSLDLLLDNYFGPAFSFAKAWGPDRWFRSRAVTIPAGLLHRSASVSIPLALTRAGTPPSGCAVVHPEYERCSTGGSWAGLLTLTRR